MSKTHLDDLPSRTDEHVGEAESRDAFRAFFRDPLFVVRDERENDYGVDATVEALAESGSPTNFRAHIQIKASDKDSNADRTYSYPVARTNLNYLLANAGSLYVFFSRAERRLYYRYAEDVFAEYEQSGSAWRSQNTVSIRFSSTLDTISILDVHRRILQAGRGERERRLRDILTAASQRTPAAEKRALTELASVFESRPIGPGLFVRAKKDGESSAFDGEGWLSSDQCAILDKIAAHQLRQAGQPVRERVLNVDEEDLAPLLRDRNPGPQFARDQIWPNWVFRAVSYPENLRSYELTVWGWLDSSFGDKIRVLLDSMLAYLGKLEKKAPGFESYTWSDLKAGGVIADDAELSLVRAIWMCLFWPVGGLDEPWGIPNDIRTLLKVGDHRELLRRRLLVDLRSEATYHLYGAV